MDPERIVQRTIRKRRRWKQAVAANVGVAVLLAALLMLLVNALAFRFYWRTDFSRTRLYELSEKTRSIVAGLEQPVDVLVFFQRGDELFHDVENSLREYQYASDLIRVEYIDPDRNLARAEELGQRFDVQGPNVVVFHQAGRHMQLGVTDLMEYDFSGARQGLAPARLRFRGEQAFSSALHHVTQAEEPIVYFLAGHGERRIDNFDPFVGYSSIARRMRRDNIELETLVLGQVTGIPEDAAALIIAGPSRRLTQPELDLIDAYLERSGRVMVLLDSLTRSGLETVLERWGVGVGDDVVIDATRTLTGRELFVTDYGVHPITSGIRGMTTVFYSPRSVVSLWAPGAVTSDQADKPHVTVLASSSASGWAERDPEQTPVRFDAGTDMSGPVSVAVAVERGPVAGIDVQIRSARLVVFGDSSFVSNGALTGGDEDFFMHALHWLLDLDELMALAPRDLDEIRLVLDRRQIRWLQKWTLGALPGFVAVLGVLVWLRRRR
jgi:ABC-type uncharacterized transport system involved in gliding motility auxiliary subunit